MVLLALLLAGVAIANNEVGGRPRDGRHALISIRAGDRDLFVRAASGGEALQLTNDAAAEGDPA